MVSGRSTWARSLISACCVSAHSRVRPQDCAHLPWPLMSPPSVECPMCERSVWERSVGTSSIAPVVSTNPLCRHAYPTFAPIGRFCSMQAALAASSSAAASAPSTASASGGKRVVENGGVLQVQKSARRRVRDKGEDVDTETGGGEAAARCSNKKGSARMAVTEMTIPEILEVLLKATLNQFHVTKDLAGAVFETFIVKADMSMEVAMSEQGKLYAEASRDPSRQGGARATACFDLWKTSRSPRGEGTRSGSRMRPSSRST